MNQAQLFIQTWQGQSVEAIEPVLKPLLNAQVENTSDHLDWSRVADELGCHALAFREAQLAVRDEPDSPQALIHLSRLLLERGNSQRAVIHLEHVLEIESENATAKALLLDIYAELGWEPRRQELAPQLATEETDSTSPITEEQAFRFLHWFGGREDAYARQWFSSDGRGGYTPVQQPLTPREIVNHFLGNVTLGVYCLRLDGTVQFMALDLDINKSALEQARVNPAKATELRQALKDTTHYLHQELNTFGLTPVIENSGYKGRHLWVLFREPVSAEVVYTFGSLLMARIHEQIPPDLHVEFFPKQPSRQTQKGLGNLIKLPLGIHRKSGRRSVLLDGDGRTISDWQSHIYSKAGVDPALLYTAIEQLKQLYLPLPERPRPSSKTDVPAPPDVPVPWTEADFETRPLVRHLFQACPVLGQLRRQVERHRQLSVEELLVLRHTLGHIPEGVLAVNYLFSRCGNISTDQFLQTPLSGNPVSCPKIRKRIPHITAKVSCNCRFDFASDHYPTPNLHWRNLPTETSLTTKEPEIPAETLARQYATLGRRIIELQQEQSSLAERLIQQLKSLPEQTLILPEGKYCLVVQDDVCELRWEPQPLVESLAKVVDENHGSVI